MALSKIAFILCRTRAAVSGFENQIGFKTSMTSAADMSATGRSPIHAR